MTVLDEHPLHGRKRVQYDIWRQAVELRRCGREWKDETRVAALRAALSEAKRFTTSLSTRALNPPTWGYITGLVEGDGHLGLSRRQARLSIHLRADDRPLLELLAGVTGFGSITYSPAYRTSMPSAAWSVSRPAELVEIGNSLQSTGIRGRKAREFVPWFEAVAELHAARSEKRTPDVQLLADCQDRLIAARRYPGVRITSRVARLVTVHTS